jgi:hypothetical protein
MSQFKNQLESYLTELEASELPTGAPQTADVKPPVTNNPVKDANTFGALGLAVSFLLFPKKEELDQLITPEEKQFLYDIDQAGIKSEDDKRKVLDILNKFDLNV